MTNQWLSIIGIGEEGYGSLSSAARLIVDNADIIFGGHRHLAMVPKGKKTFLPWKRPLHSSMDDLIQYRDQEVCVLATGDPFCYGVGNLITKWVPIDEINVIPAPSAFSLATARTGWVFEEIDFVTLHGRNDALLEVVIQPKAKLLILAHSRSTPSMVAKKLVKRGFGESNITVFERMGNLAERTVHGKANDWLENDFDPLHTIAVECIAEPLHTRQSRLSCLADDAFSHDGKITKEDIRSISITALMPAPGQLLWDVGAGCGSISIEWMRRDKRSRAVAIECQEKRLRFIAKNAVMLGTPDLKIINGRAPQALEKLETPDAIFIGGGLSNVGVFEACWQALRVGGRLVVNAVTTESEVMLIKLNQNFGGDLTRITISKTHPLGKHTGWKTLLPTLQWRVTKGCMAITQ